MIVLVAVEDSATFDALDQFIQHYDFPDPTKLVLVHAGDTSEKEDIRTGLFEATENLPLVQELKILGQAMLKSLKERLSSELPDHVEVEDRVIVGKAQRVILQQAQQLCADMIVMGSHRKTWLDRVFHRSTSEFILSHARCSVYMTKLPCESSHIVAPPDLGLGQEPLFGGKSPT